MIQALVRSLCETEHPCYTVLHTLLLNVGSSCVNTCVAQARSSVTIQCRVEHATNFERERVSHPDTRVVLDILLYCSFVENQFDRRFSKTASE